MSSRRSQLRDIYRYINRCNYISDALQQLQQQPTAAAEVLRFTEMMFVT